MFKIPELYLSSVTNLDFPKFDLSSIVYHFWRLNDIKLPTFFIFRWFGLSLSEVG